jgi:hypothetical protein
MLQKMFKGWKVKMCTSLHFLSDQIQHTDLISNPKGFVQVDIYLHSEHDEKSSMHKSD